VVASLNRPIVTDYHPLRNRPVLSLLVIALMAAAVVARDLASAVVVVTAAALGGVALWLSDPARSDRHRSADDPDPPG
jgi:hypothetical protein